MTFTWGQYEDPKIPIIKTRLKNACLNWYKQMVKFHDVASWMLVFEILPHWRQIHVQHDWKYHYIETISLQKNEFDNFCKIDAYFSASIYICSLVFVFDPIFVIVFIFETEKMYLYWSCWWNGFDPGPGLLNEMFSILNLNPSDICMTRSQNVHLFWPKESCVNEVKIPQFSSRKVI